MISNEYKDIVNTAKERLAYGESKQSIYEDLVSIIPPAEKRKRNHFTRFMSWQPNPDPVSKRIRIIIWLLVCFSLLQAFVLSMIGLHLESQHSSPDYSNIIRFLVSGLFVWIAWEIARKRSALPYLILYGFEIISLLSLLPFVRQSPSMTLLTAFFSVGLIFITIKARNEIFADFGLFNKLKKNKDGFYLVSIKKPIRLSEEVVVKKED